MNGNTRKQKTVDPDTLPAIVVAESEGAAEYIAMLRRQRAELVKVLEQAREWIRFECRYDDTWPVRRDAIDAILAKIKKEAKP